jgi:two-component system sensor histidine kinase RegB
MPSPLTPHAPSRPAEDRASALLWVIHLRWVAVVAQALLIAWVDLSLHLSAPLRQLAVVWLLEGLSNLYAHLWLHRRRRGGEPVGVRPLWIVLTADILCLTALLMLTGGPYNPFSFVYLIHITLATLTLPAPLAWGVMLESVASMGLLFVGYERGSLGALAERMGASHAARGCPVAHQAAHHAHTYGGDTLVAQLMQLHVEGMWVACAAAGVMIVYFTQRIQRDAEEAKRALREAERRAEEAQRFASLTTLAAGAAHELATPLASISLACEEPLRAPSLPLALDALALISGEARRCVAVIERLRGALSEGDGALRMDLGDLLEDAVEGALEERGEQAWRVEVSLSAEDAATEVRGHALGLTQALRALVGNALRASPPGVPVEVRGWVEGARASVEVVDRGVGMPPNTLARLGEPFFSEAGGLGLGVFLARQVVTLAGGELRYESALGEGTRVRLSFPVFFITPTESDLR